MDLGDFSGGIFFGLKGFNLGLLAAEEKSALVLLPFANEAAYNSN